MVSSVDHYANHLGPIYTWMVGDIDAALARSGADLDALALPQGAATAVDLGAGFGLHAIPLARRGLSVLAIDSYEPLLQELAARQGALPIRTVTADLLDFRAHIGGSADVILCMGDTLTHLPDTQSVLSLCTNVAASLAPGGVFVATFRDYASQPLAGDQRFIPVRADAERILTCFLEYADSSVTVHDLLHQRDGGAWRLSVSSYRKLRLAPQWLAGELQTLGLDVSRDLTGGMVRMTARKSRR